VQGPRAGGEGQGKKKKRREGVEEGKKTARTHRSRESRQGK
jgi:hypothetical protein